jgi:hypothetical protein
MIERNGSMIAVEKKDHNRHVLPFALPGFSTCAVKRCTGLPTAAAPALSSGWNDTCSNTTHGTVCTAACVGNATGGYSSTCFEGTWTNSTTTCQRELLMPQTAASACLAASVDS